MHSNNRFQAEDRRVFNPVFRIVALGMAVVLCFCLLLTSLYRLQLNEGESYLAAAEDTKTQVISVEGSRGDILDTNGVVLATNRECYEVTFTWDPDKRTSEGNANYTKSLLLVIDQIGRAHV